MSLVMQRRSRTSEVLGGVDVDRKSVWPAPSGKAGGSKVGDTMWRTADRDDCSPDACFASTVAGSLSDFAIRDSGVNSPPSSSAAASKALQLPLTSILRAVVSGGSHPMKCSVSAAVGIGLSATRPLVPGVIRASLLRRHRGSS